MAKIRGTWKWNEKFYGDWLSQVSYTITAPITFRSNNQTFSELSLFTYHTNLGPVGIRYDNIEVRSLYVYEDAPGEYYTEDEFNEEYRVMEFGTTEQEIDDELYDFITQNASLDMVAEKLLIAAEKIPQVYDAGKQAEYDAFWDALQNYGDRKEYSATFAQWSIEYIRPKYKVAPTNNNVGSLFNNNKKLLAVEKAYFDFSQIITLTADYICNACDKLLVFEDCGLPALDRYNYCWRYCSKLQTIEILRCKGSTTFNNAFTSCRSLENIKIEGIIGQNIDFQWSTLLTRASIKSIIEHLSLSASIANGKTLTLSKKAVDAAIDGYIWNDEHQSAIYVEGKGSETDTWQNLIAGVVDAGWAITLV